MKQRLMTNAFDLWVFHRSPSGPRYLLLYTSQEKADKWFGGGRFWQIPCEFLTDDESMLDGIHRCLADLELTASAIWAGEHVYTIYNRRFDALQIVPTFVAEVDATVAVRLTWEHTEAAWLSADECNARFNFGALKESLIAIRGNVTENTSLPKEFRLA